MGRALEGAVARLAGAGVADARRNAQLLLAHLLETDLGGLLVHRNETLEPRLARRFASWIGRRERREPLQHITGIQEFYGLAFEVDRRVLVPRPETEGLVDVALGLGLPPGARVIDLGTGSGCIAIALARYRSDLRIYALERSRDALAVARRNARRHGVEGRIDLRHGDLTRAPGIASGSFHLVVCNPPYVSEAEWSALEPEVRDHDPKQALVAGPTGYEVYRALAPAAAELLRPGGTLLLELGRGQAHTVSDIVVSVGLRVVEIRPDLNRIPRVLRAGKSGSAPGPRPSREGDE